MTLSENAPVPAESDHAGYSWSDVPAWLMSCVVHLVLVLSLALLNAGEPRLEEELEITSLPFTEQQQEQLEVPPEFAFSNEAADQVGAGGLAGSEVAMASAPNAALISEAPLEVRELIENSPIDMQPIDVIPTSDVLIKDISVKGSVGVAATGAMGAVDRITHEIMMSLEQQQTLVVWMFDRSISMQVQREELNGRLEKIYDELGIIEASGNQAFTKHTDKPLLSSVIAFGQDVQTLVKPTDDVDVLKKAIQGIQADESGLENIFTAIDMAVEQYKVFRIRAPRRNVMLIVFSDEGGSDQQRADRTTTICRRFEIPVYVVGVPAPFGQRQTFVKYVNPDPRFEQVVQWAPLDQGPETFLPEMVQLVSPGGEPAEAIDSGYGPYSLTRLCYETGGIYFAVHPNRDKGSNVTRAETQIYSAHLANFFDPDVMRRYRPDYVPIKEYQRLVNQNKAKSALVTAAQMPGINQLETPRLVFLKRDEAQFATLLTQAQQAAAMIEPKINQTYEILKAGEKDRPAIEEPRWRAGYDLAMGRTLASKVRTEAYNLMLAKAKQGLLFKNKENNTWNLVPVDSITVGSVLEKQANQATMYLTRVVSEHPNTPWALLAQKELEQKFGWVWEESYTFVPEPGMNRPNANNPPVMPRRPADEQARMLARKPPPPPPPKL